MCHDAVCEPTRYTGTRQHSGSYSSQWPLPGTGPLGPPGARAPRGRDSIRCGGPRTQLPRSQGSPGRASCPHDEQVAQVLCQRTGGAPLCGQLRGECDKAGVTHLSSQPRNHRHHGAHCRGRGFLILVSFGAAQTTRGPRLAPTWQSCFQFQFQRRPMRTTQTDTGHGCCLWFPGFASCCVSVGAVGRSLRISSSATYPGVRPETLPIPPPTRPLRPASRQYSSIRFPSVAALGSICSLLARAGLLIRAMRQTCDESPYSTDAVLPTAQCPGSPVPVVRKEAGYPAPLRQPSYTRRVVKFTRGVIEMAKTKSSAKATKKAQSSAADYLKRLGPVRRVIAMARDHSTKNSYRLRLECKHTRVGTKRRSLRCRRCLTAKGK